MPIELSKYNLHPSCRIFESKESFLEFGYENKLIPDVYLKNFDETKSFVVSNRDTNGKLCCKIMDRIN
jgi:hypothetical protein